MNPTMIAIALALLSQDRQPVAGEVVDAQSRPIAGTAVVLMGGPTRDGSVPILGRTTTGADGRFRLERPDAARLA